MSLGDVQSSARESVLASRGTNELTELFLKDFPYVLQGVETSMIAFSDSDVLLPKEFPLPLASRAQKLCEPAVLYRSVGTLLANQRQSMVIQALTKCIKSQLEDYLLLIAEIESRVRSKDVTLTLTACDALLTDSVLALRLIHSIAREFSTEGLRSGEILSLLQEYTRHGDPYVRSLGTELFKAANEPFQKMLDGWTRHGRIDDPFGEFFVSAKSDQGRSSGEFSIIERNIPHSMTLNEARHAFEAGRTLYMLRTLFNEEDYVRMHGPEMTLKSHNEEFEATSYLNSILVDKFHLRMHLKALQDYILLFKGDFAEQLVVEAYKSLRIPADRISRPLLNNVMCTAVDFSSARFDDPEVLSRLDYSSLDKGTGQQAWEVFTMEYRLGSPLNAIITAETYETYSKLFNILWSLRWASHVLTLAWQTMRELGQKRDPYQGNKQAGIVKCEILRHKLSRMICELLANAYTTVIESEWSTLQSQLPPYNEKPVTIDEIRAAHHTYIERIYVGASLGGTVSMIMNIRRLLKLSIDFQRAVAARVDRGDWVDTNPSTRLFEEKVQGFHDIYADICTRMADELERHENGSLRTLGSKIRSPET